MDFCDDFEDFEDEFPEDLEMDDPFSDESERESEPDEAESHDDDFTAKDAFILGGAIGWAFERGLRAQKRKKRKRFRDDYN
jgi:hypothetical protein